MGASALVGLEIQVGSRVVAVLENAGIVIKVALWMATSEYEDGRLVLASPSLDQTNILRAYEKVFEILRAEPSHSRPLLLIMRMKDPFIQDIRKRYAKTEAVEGMRLDSRTIGNRFLLDGYVYRVR